MSSSTPRRASKKARRGSAADAGKKREDDKPFELLLVQTVIDEASRVEDALNAQLEEQVSRFPKLEGLRRSVITPGQILVSIPADALSPKDIAGGAYFAKRDAALNNVTAKAEKTKKAKRPVELASDSASVHLAGCAPEGVFPIRKLAPGHCNSKSQKGDSNLLPTPRYNSRILEDVLRIKHEEAVQSALDVCPEFGNALRLMRIWFAHHQPEDLVGTFPIKPLVLFLAELVVSPRERSIWSKASSSQLFKRGIRWLAENDLAGEDGPRKVARLGDALHKVDGFEDADFLEVFPITVVDNTGCLNLAHSTLASSYRLLRAQAKATLSEHDEEAVFTSKVPSWERFDRLIRINLPSPPEPTADHVSADEEANALLDDSWATFACRKLDTLVFRGLMETGRVKQFGLCKLSDAQSSSATGVVVLGLCIDPEKAFRLVDRGPPAEDLTAAGHFRAFWGDKAELRRFKDGSIVESVVWEDNKKRVIPEMIVDHLLSIHAPFSRVESSSTTLRTRAISQALESAADDRDEEGTRYCLKLFSQIERRVRGASGGLPLQVTDVVLARAPALRYTGFLPSKHYMAFGTRDTRGRKDALALAKSGSEGGQLSRCVPLAGEIFVRFEGTSRWPDDADAKKKLECVLLCELARSIERSEEGGDDDDGEAEPFFADCFVSTDNHVDILTRGYAFRLSSMTSWKEPAAKLHSLLHSLHHRADYGASRSFGQIARLAKQWVSGQRLSSVVSDDFVDLLVASLFTSSYPCDPPRGALCGLLRFFGFIAQFDFDQRPVIVDLVDYRSPSEQVKAEADKCFFQQKHSGSTLPITIYVRTRGDKEDENFFVPWTDPDTALTAHSLGVLVQRARASKVYLEMLCDKESSDVSTVITLKMWKAIFNSDPYADMDGVLLLENVADQLDSRGATQQTITQFQNLLVSASRQALVGFDPLSLLLKELKEKFANHAEFFAGSVRAPASAVSSTRSIGISWKSSKGKEDGASHAFPFKISTAKYALPSTTVEGKLEFNYQELVDEMCRVGRGLISTVHLRRSEASG